MAGFFEANRSGGRGGYTRRENVVFIVDKVVADPKNKEGNWETDHFEGRLMYSALGVEAQYDNGEPTTKVKVFQTKPAEKSGSFPRPSVHNKLFKPAIGDKLQPGGLMLIEGATFDKTRGGFVGDWFKVMSASTYEPDVQFPTRGWIMVKGEYKNDDNTTVQRSVILDSDYSETFKGVGEFRSMAIGMLDNALAQPSLPGVPAVVVRAVDPESKQALTVEIPLAWDRENMRRMSPTETVDAFLDAQRDVAANPDQTIARGSWITAMDGDAPFFFEVVPASTINTGKQSLPTVRAEAKKKGEPADYCDSVGSCTYPVVRERDGVKKTYLNTGYIKADVFAVRKLAEDAPGFSGDEKHTPWTRTYTRSTGENGELRGRSEFPSGKLPEEIEAVFSARGKENGKAAATWRKARKPTAPDATAQASEQVEDQAMANAP